MPNGGSDCCATCPWNGVNKGKLKYPPSGSEDFFCEIRKFKIETPYWTYCNNHPRRNPLWRTKPRGPIWAAIYQDYDSKHMSDDLHIPPEFIPPQGDAMYVRVPYYEGIRPYGDRDQVCEICKEKSESNVTIVKSESEFISFCSVAHYFEWWLHNSPEVKKYLEKPTLKPNEVLIKFVTLNNKIKEIMKVKTISMIREVLIELDDLLIDLGQLRIDSMHAKIYLQYPKTRGKLSPQLLQLKVELESLAYKLREEKVDWDKLNLGLIDIQKNIDILLSLLDSNK